MPVGYYTPGRVFPRTSLRERYRPRLKTIHLVSTEQLVIITAPSLPFSGRMGPQPRVRGFATLTEGIASAEAFGQPGIVSLITHDQEPIDAPENDENFYLVYGLLSDTGGIATAEALGSPTVGVVIDIVVSESIDEPDNSLNEYTVFGILSDVGDITTAEALEEPTVLEVEVTLPGQASNPDPPDSATNQELTVVLSWIAGSDTDSHDVYLGTSPILGPSHFRGNQPGTSYDPPSLNYNATYYWRIDEVNDAGTTTGEVWSFSTVPVPSGTPSLGFNPTHRFAISGDRMTMFPWRK